MSSSLTSKKIIRMLFQRYRISPSRGLGQNFLIDKSALKKLISAANLKPSDTVLEIGPGMGNLTKELAKRARKVVAIEKDWKMCEVLEKTLKSFDNIKIIRGDILKLSPMFYTEKSYKVVANLPFYLTAPAIRKFLEGKSQPQVIVLMVQKEMAQRIAARPPKMNLLAVSVQFYAKPEIIAHISKKSFWPQPKVDSAIIKIVPHGVILDEQFFRIVRSGFSQPRKQLVNNLSKKLKLDKEQTKLWLWKNKIKPERRAEGLTIEDWINLAKTFDDKKY